MVGEAIFPKGLGEELGIVLLSLCGQGGRGVRRSSILLREPTGPGYPVLPLTYLHEPYTSPQLLPAVLGANLYMWVCCVAEAPGSCCGPLDSIDFGLLWVLDTPENAQKAMVPIPTQEHAYINLHATSEACGPLI